MIKIAGNTLCTTYVVLVHSWLFKNAFYGIHTTMMRRLRCIRIQFDIDTFDPSIPDFDTSRHVAL